MKTAQISALYKSIASDAGQEKHMVRVLAELKFLAEMSRVKEGRFDDAILSALEFLNEQKKQTGTLTIEDVWKAEERLSDLAPEAKKYEMTCAAHAHIDMNWMWGYQETASIVVDTFRTMLILMREYPQFTFSQSQASVYKIIEDYCPEMLEEIRKRVQEGRWEVTASTWVENDKNMSGSEAMARHLLYTKTYLSQLLGIAKEDIQLDFEPDTFGHSVHMPEILTSGGVRYYYHCRGNDDENIYRWRSPSGAEVLVFREPAWYLGRIDYDLAAPMPEFCRRMGVPRMLKVYGVGDHGGGPTRKDIERILEMASWPLYPTIRFGTIQGFFHDLEPDREKFPVVERELNFFSTGCYTSQSEIKRANKLGEDRLYDAEAYDTMASALCGKYKTASAFAPAWRKLLFNQFHDILPGSGKAETRNFALGEFQKLMATANINATHSMTEICRKIDTSSFGEPESLYGTADRTGMGAEGLAMGAGAGFETAEHFPVAERNDGNRRAYTIFNPLPREREELCELTLWDWPGKPEDIEVLDGEGKALPLQLNGDGRRFWGHQYQKLLVPVKVPAFGYTTCLVREKESWLEIPVNRVPRCDAIESRVLVLENQKLRAEFEPETMKLLSLVQKETGKELIEAGHPGAVFRLVTEETSQGMTAWRVGKYAGVRDLNEEQPVFVSKIRHDALRQSIEYQIKFGSSVLDATVSLDEGSDTLRFDLQVDWQEIGREGAGVPQLNFWLSLAQKARGSLCAVPFGTIERAPMHQDVPCIGWMASMAVSGSPSVLLMSDCKYGFRCEEDSMAVTLLRGSFDPDPYPEIGLHRFSIGIAVSELKEEAFQQRAEAFTHPLSVCSTGIHEGTLPMTAGILNLEGNAVVTAFKRAETGEGMILRMYNPLPETSAVKVDSPLYEVDWEKTEAVDMLEHSKGRPLTENGQQNVIRIVPYSICALRLYFR